jgi:hypothetical protein
MREYSLLDFKPLQFLKTGYKVHIQKLAKKKKNVFESESFVAQAALKLLVLLLLSPECWDYTQVLPCLAC